MSTAAKDTIKIILKNWNALVWFEIPYKAIGFSFIYPFINTLLSNILKVTGISYISQENIQLIFTTPSAILLALCACVTFVLYVYLEIAALIIYCDSGWKNRHISILRLWKDSIYELFKTLRYNNWLLFLSILPIITFSFLRLISGNLNALRIPEFVMEFIIENKSLSIAFTGLILAINILIFLYIFGIPAIVIENRNFIGSWKKSLHLLRGRKLSTILVLICWIFIFSISVLSIAAIAIGLLFLYSKLFFPVDKAKYVFQNSYIRWSKIGMIMFKILNSVTICSLIVNLYYRYSGNVSVNKITFSFKSFIKFIFTIFCTFVLLTIYSETEMGGNINFFKNPFTKIVAHRAGAALAPENTAVALNFAINDRADMAEIDIQQLKDGTLIVMHDSNFKRTTGVDKNVWEVDYETVKSFDAGSTFSSKFKGEKIPTLEQMLILAKNRIDLMIEIKATGYEHNLEKDVVDLIHKYHMEKQCTIASMNLNILKQIKKLDSNLKTIYISAIFISDRYDLAYIDGYSIEASSISYAMVVQSHVEEKEIYAWTTNSERTIKNALKNRVDGIITDNPLLAHYCLTESGKNSLLNSLTEILYPMHDLE